MSELRRRQHIFAECLGKWIVWVYSKGWKLTLSEGYIGDSINKPSEDTPHLRTGNHFNKLAIDVNLFVGDMWLKNGDDPEWAEAGAKWESLNALCRWGGRFQDANHLSVEDVDGSK